MALPLTTDNLESIPEAIRDQYVQEGDKFRLSLDGYEDPAGLKSALEKERKAAREASKSASQWASLGKSPDEIQQLLEAQKKAEEEKLNKAGEWDKLRAQMNEAHQKQLSEYESKLKAKDGAIERYLIDAQAVQAVSQEKGVPELLLPHVKAHVRVVDENGELQVRVVDKLGQPRVNGAGDYISISDLVREMRQDEIFGRAFLSSGGNGGGAQPSAQPSNTSPLKRSDMTAEQKHEYLQKHGQSAYLKLPN